MRQVGRGRRIPPPATDPWSRRAKAAADAVSRDGSYQVPLDEFLADAEWAFRNARRLFGQAFRMGGWNTAEDLVRNWAKLRRWRVVIDREHNLFALEQAAIQRQQDSKPKRSARTAWADPNQPTLFDDL